MGLAAVLKRKLGGGDAANGHQKRARPTGGSGPQALPADAAGALREQLANGGFAALAASFTSKNTRTALRKQRKAEQLARQQAAEQRRQEKQREQRRADGHGSDSEDGTGVNGVAGLEGKRLQHEQDDEAQQAAAYSRLLGTLGSVGGAYADALQQRQREQAGDSDASDSEDAGSEEDGSELGEEEDDEGGSDLESLPGSEGGAAAGSQEKEEEGGAASDGEEADGVASGSEVEEDSSGSEQEEEQEAAAEAGAEERQRKHLGSSSVAAGEAAAGAAAAAVEDHYLSHFDSELSEERAAELLDSNRRTRYADCTSASSRGSKGKASAGSKGGEQGPAVAPDVLKQWPHAALQAAEGTCLPQSAPADLAAYGVKERLAGRWREVAALPAVPEGGSSSASVGDFVSGQQRALFSLLSCYSDLLLASRRYPTDPEAADPQMDAVLLHLLSHCAKAADRIKKNNDRLRAAAAGAGGAGSKDGSAVDAVPKDQGFTRAKVLLLLPQRNLALRVVSRLLQLAVKETRTDTIQNKQRFLEEFGDGGEELSEREKAAVARKPAAHRALFHGNTDDHFRLGIKLTRGAVKLFADFFDSDIIVASPLALATRLAEASDDGAADFLSSIEILVAERADVLLMQNWAHMVTVFDALNRIPKDGHGVDMMRVRDWALSGRAALYRQTILLSSFASAEMNALLARTCRNHGGKVRVQAVCRGVLSHIIPQARQVFERMPAPVAGTAAITDADARFEHFKRSLWPRIKESGRSGGHLIYLPSYFDYVRVRNFLREEMASFLGLCEYTERSDAARARSYFYDKRKEVLLYTERAQFYNRHRIRGIKEILFYQLPEHADFYAELLNLLEEGETGETPTVTVVFSKFDALRLERVVGSSRSTKMLKEKKTGTFLFC